MKKRFYQFIGSALTACMLLSDLGTMAVYAAPIQSIGKSGIEETIIGEPDDGELKIGEPDIEVLGTEGLDIEGPGIEETDDNEGEGEWDWLNNVSASFRYSSAGYTCAIFDVNISSYNVSEEKLNSVGFVLFATKDSTASWLTGDTVLNAVPSGVVISNSETGSYGSHTFTLPNGDAKLDPDTDYTCRLMVSDGGAYHPLASAQSFRTVAIPNVSASSSAGSYTAEVKAIFGSEDDDWETKSSLQRLYPVMIYTDDTSKDLFNGKAAAASLDDYQQMESLMSTEYIDSDGVTKTRIYTLFDLSDNGPLKPGTQYRYRIALPDQGRYCFVSDVSSFTTLDSVSQSAVSIGDVTVTDYGYEAETVRFRIANPGNELILNKVALDGNGNEYSLWEAGEDEDPGEAGEDAGQLYETTVPAAAGVKIRVVVYTGNVATETNIDRVLSEDEIKKQNIGGRAISASFNELLTGMETDFTVKPSYEVDEYLVTLYYKKTTESDFHEATKYMEDNENVTFSVRDMEPGQDYQYYLTLTSPFKPGEILYQNGSATEPHTTRTGTLVTYTKDDFKDKALYDELTTRGFELTNVNLYNLEYLSIEGIEGSTPISSLEDIPEKMPSLRTLNITGHDITDITPLLSMKELRNIDLAGNEIETLPNLSEVKWRSFGLEGTYVTSDEVYNRAGYRGSVYISDPREREAEALKTVYTDDAGQFPLILRYDGKSDGRRYSFTVTMGDVTKTYNSDDESVYYSSDYNHGAFVIPDIKKDFSLETGKDYSFRITIKDAYHTDALCDRTFTMRFEKPEYEPTDEYITPAMSSVYLYQTVSPDTFKTSGSPYRAEIRKGEKVYFTSNDLNVDSGNICADLYSDMLGYNTYRFASSEMLTYNAVRINVGFTRMLMPTAGDYDVYYYDNSGQQLLKVEGKIHVSAEAVTVAGAAPVYGYGNTEKYIYVEVYGQNLSLSTAPVIADGKETFTEAVSVRQFEKDRFYEDNEGYYGFDKYVFKLRKRDNWKKIQEEKPSKTYTLVIEGKKVTDLRSESAKKIRAGALQGDFSSEIYLSSAEYNWKKDVFEFSFRAPLATDTLITAEIGTWDDYSEGMNVKASGSGRIDENGVLRMRFYDANGVKYEAANETWAYVRFYKDGEAFSEYPEEFRIYFYNYWTGATYGKVESVDSMNCTLATQYYREGSVSIDLLCTGPAKAHKTDDIFVEIVKEDWEYDDVLDKEKYVTTVIASKQLAKVDKNTNKKPEEIVNEQAGETGNEKTDETVTDEFKAEKWEPKLPKGEYTLRYYEMREGAKYTFSSWPVYVAGEGFIVTFDSVSYFGKGKEANLFLTAPYLATGDVATKDIPAFVEANKLELKVYDKQRNLVSAESTVSQVNKSGIIGWYIKGLDPEAEGYYFAVTANGQVPTDIYGNKLYQMVVGYEEVDDWSVNEIYGDDPCGKWYAKNSYTYGYGLKDGIDGINIGDGWGNAPYKLRFYRYADSATMITEITVRADQLKNGYYYLTDENAEPLDPDVIYLCNVSDSVNNVIGTLVGYFRSDPDRFRNSSKKVQLRSVKILNAASLFVGETKQLSVQFTPSDASTKTVSWSSSNPAVATISNYGYVTALSEGQTTITLQSTDTKVKAVTYVLQVIDKNKSLYVEFVDKGPFVYSGKKITPNVVVYYGGKKLVEGVDYKLTYSNNLNASVNTNAKIKVAGIKVSGTVEKEYTIQPRSIDDSAVKVAETIVESGKKATPVLYLGSYKMTAKDFTFDKDMKFTANGTMVVTGKGNFKGSRIIDVTVGKPLKFKVSYFKANGRTYNGQDQKLTAKELTVVDATTSAVLKEGTDYILSYPEDICSAGTKKVSIIGIGRYNTVTSKSYRINPLKALGVAAFVDAYRKMDPPYASENLNIPYHPGAVTPEVMVLYKKNELIPNVDYTVKYNKNTKVGKAEVKVSFAGNYKGTSTITKNFDIVKAPLNADNVRIYCPDLAWTKDAKYVSEPYVTMDGRQISKSDYTVTYTLNGSDISKKMITKADLGKDNAAVVNVTVEGKSNMKGTATTSFRVVYSPKENDLAKAKLTIRDQNGKKVSTLPYTGTEVEFKGDYRLEVTLNGVPLKEGVDYKIEYANNVNKGAAVAIVTGLGETSTEKTKYYGSKTLKFTIKKGTLSWH